MPKATTSQFPLQGLFAINKPSGPTSMLLLEHLKHLFNASPLFIDPNEKKGGGKKKGKGHGGVKIGQGGTLDPLADGVLVVGIGKGTKQLSKFLDCSKEYRSTGMLGCSTDSYDSEGAIVSTAPWQHVTREMVEGVLDRFRGNILQTPPIYSALKMDGKPLYEYARSNTPLPRPIEARTVTVHDLVLESWEDARVVENGPGHTFKWPTKTLTPEELETLERSQTLIKAAGVVVKGAEAEAGDKIVLPDLTPAAAEVASSSDAATTSSSTSTTVIPPVFTIRMTVSSGTYVRSIVHDIGLAVGSLAHVVVLSRTRQGSFALSTAGSPPKPDGTPAATHECVEWSVFEEAVEVHERAFKIKKEAQAALRKEEKAMGPAALKAKRRAEQEAQRKAMEMAEEEEEMIASAQEPEPVVVSKEEELKAWEREVLAKFDVLD